MPLFNLLAASKEFNFDFFFEATHPWIGQMMVLNKQYRPRFQYSVSRGLRLLQDSHLSVSLLFSLLRRRYDAYVFCPLASPDCLITFLAAKSFRKPFILWEERWEPTRSFLSKLLEPIQLLIARRADLIIVPGSKSLEYFATVTGRKDQIIIAPNASVMEKPSAPSVERSRWSNGVPGDAKVIVYLGRLLRTKGVDNLLRAFAMLEAELGHGVFLLVAGDGEERRKLQSLAEALNLRNAKFTCHDVYDQAAYLSLADVVVLPSNAKGGHSEVWGLVINEAISLGKPVVVTKSVGCANDIVKTFQCGYVVEDENSEELYSAIRNILRDPELALRMGANGIKATKEEFSYEKMAREFLHAVGKVLVKQGDSSFARK